MTTTVSDESLASGEECKLSVHFTTPKSEGSFAYKSTLVSDSFEPSTALIVGRSMWPVRAEPTQLVANIGGSKDIEKTVRIFSTDGEEFGPISAECDDTAVQFSVEPDRRCSEFLIRVGLDKTSEQRDVFSRIHVTTGVSSRPKLVIPLRIRNEYLAKPEREIVFLGTVRRDTEVHFDLSSDLDLDASKLELSSEKRDASSGFELIGSPQQVAGGGWRLMVRTPSHSGYVRCKLMITDPAGQLAEYLVVGLVQ